VTLWIVAVIAVLTIVFLLKSRDNYLELPELPVEAGAETGDVTVVIPARNEAANIARAVESLRGVPIIVVDDESGDGTAELARKAGATVISAPKLPGGALGKPNACQAGARVSHSDWILFTDADTCYKPEFLPSIMHYARSEKLDIVTVFLRQERGTLAEKLVLPYAAALYFAGVNEENVNSGRSQEALANGQCMLFRRNTYDFLGGHAAVIGNVIEDVEFASLAKRHRVRLRVLRAEGLGSVRMYGGLGGIWRGFQKNAFGFLMINKWSGFQVVLLSLLLTLWAPVIVWLVLCGWWKLAILFGLVPPVLLWRWYGNPFTALLSPIAIYFFQLIALSSVAAFVHGRGVKWKGRRVS
jgi:glycosyltransferase involved in cell wall biosynthesis